MRSYLVTRAVLVVVCLAVSLRPHSSMTAEAATFDFAQYKTCQQCIGAGFGWCAIQRICGGFANRQCGEGPRYHRADYDPKADGEAKKPQEEVPKKKEKEIKSKKSADSEPSSYESGKVYRLSTLDFSKAVRSSKDFWAVYYYSPKSENLGGGGNERSFPPASWDKLAKATRRIDLKMISINLDESSADSIFYKGDLFKNLARVPSVVLYLDNRDELPQLRFDNENLEMSEMNVASWVTSKISGAVLDRVSGAEKLRRERLREQEKHKGGATQSESPLDDSF